MAEQKKTAWKRLQKFFRIGVKKDTPSGGASSTEKPWPTQPDTKDPGAQKGDNPIPVQFPQPFKALYDWWLSQCHDSSESFRERKNRVQDLDYMVKNEEIISMAADTMADETVQIDSNGNEIEVEASQAKVRNRIQELLDRWGYTSERLRDIAYNLVMYGDHFDANTIFMNHGITDVTPLDVLAVSDRIEFSIRTMMENKGTYRSTLRTLSQKDTRLQDLINALDFNQFEDYSQLFKSYLFGFTLFEGALTLPPWSISHFRLFSSNSEFAPFGRPIFINSISPFRQLRASVNLMAIARIGKFPREVFEVKSDERSTEFDQWEAVNQVRESFHNINQDTTNSDELGIDSRFWFPEGLVNYRLQESRVNMDDIADVEYFRENLIMGSRIPKGYLIVDKSAFGTSGQSLLRQHKPFGRAVYAVQSAILEEIANQIRTHFVVTGEFEGAETEFKLSMPYPVVEESQDQLRMKTDTLRLANDIVSNIQQALGTRDGLPPEVVKSIFSNISFLDPDDVEQWLDSSADALGLTEDGKSVTLVNRQMKIEEKTKIWNRLSEDVIHQVYLHTLKRHNVQEGVWRGRHFRTSWVMTPQQRSCYEILKKDPSKELREEDERRYHALKESSNYQ